jgi:hypothetical protein
MITYKKIYNKVATRLFSGSLLLATCSLMMVSCVDTLILPDNKTVDEDFWKSKSDVQLMVNGAYQRMLNADVISRLIVWGDLRSEEMIPVASIVVTPSASSFTLRDNFIMSPTLFKNLYTM